MTPKMPPVVGIVACLLPEFGIGHNGTLPWRLSKEMKFFRQATTSTTTSGRQNVVIMGRKTWESIPARFRPLPNRLNIVVSRAFTEQLELDTVAGCYQTSSLEAAVKRLQMDGSLAGKVLDRIYVIGGAEIYSRTFDLADFWLVSKLRTLPGTTIPAIDTYLDREQLHSKFEMVQDETKMQAFLPADVELPVLSKTKDNNGERFFIQEEKGYDFGISLYQRK